MNIKYVISSVIALGTVTQVASASPGVLTSEQWLMPNQATATSCFYRATMRPDGNFVLTDNGTSHVYWQSATAGSGGYLKMQSDGNLVLNNWADNPVWTAWTQGNPGAYTKMQDDGNLVIYRPNNTPLWSSGTAGERLGSSNCYGSNFAATQVWTGWNASGGDYSHFTLGTPRASWCAYYCSQDSNCKAFTYVPPGIQGAQAVCWLKNGAYNWYPDDRMVSGVIVH